MRVQKPVITGLSLAAALVVGPALMASAAPTEAIGNGERSGGVVIVGETQGTSSSTATIQNAGSGDGSFWQWGVGSHDTYSNYFRERSCHGSTAVGKKTKRVTNVRGGVYSKALTPKASSGNKAYYHTC